MVWIVGMSGGKPRFGTNRQIQHIGICKSFLYKCQTVIHKTGIELSLQVPKIKHL